MRQEHRESAAPDENDPKDGGHKTKRRNKVSDACVYVCLYGI